MSSLLTLSESLVKHETNLEQSLSKIVEAIKSLIQPPAPGSGLPSSENRTSSLDKHLVAEDGRPYDEFLESWEWDSARYRYDDKRLDELVDALIKDAQDIDNAQRNVGQKYGAIKGAVTAAARKRSGNLSTRSLNDVVSERDFKTTNDSEYLETVLVAVPNNNVKDWNESYERLAGMVVPRSSTKIASDDEYTLFSVVIFRRARDEFAQKSRERKFILRDFTYDADEQSRADKELNDNLAEERELWTDYLRLSRINFGELFAIVVHVKVVKAFVEAVLRYGLPAVYFSALLFPDPKNASKLMATLTKHFDPILPKTQKAQRSKKSSSGADDGGAGAGEYAQMLEGEYKEFVCEEIRRVE